MTEITLSMSGALRDVGLVTSPDTPSTLLPTAAARAPVPEPSAHGTDGRRRVAGMS